MKRAIASPTKRRFKPHPRISAPYSKALGFSPIYINQDALSMPQLMALYKYTSLFFPGIMDTLADMEKNTIKLKKALSESEMEKLIRDLRDVKIKITASMEDEKQGEIVSIPLDIRPALVLENVMRGKPLERVKIQELEEVFIPLIKKELRRRLTEIAEGYFELELGKAETSVAVKELLEQGLITPKGELARKVTVDDLISENHVKVFKTINIQELVTRGLIKQ